MSAFAPSSKKHKIDDNLESKEERDWFASIPTIAYNPTAPLDQSLVFRHYNAKEIVAGRSMEEWLRFGVCYWHTFRGTGADPFGFPTFIRPWDDGTDSLDNALRRLRVAFQFFVKLGVKYWTFHDRDIAPEGKDWEETCKNLDACVALAKQLQDQTGVKLLWGTANLFSHARYMNGAATNPDAHVVAYAAAQVKKAMEVTHLLGGVNYVFWGGREGYQSILNTNVKKELDHMAAFFRMAVEYKKKIGFTGQFLIEPKPKEPTKHQYDYDAQTVIGFLKTYNLDKDFKLNIEPNHTTLAGHDYAHDIEVSSKFGFLGSIDANTGDQSLGWDTDQFPSDIKNSTQVMLTVLNQKGLEPGGLNFDCKPRRESNEVEDMFISHIVAMDTFARGLRNAAKIIADGTLQKLVNARYSSFESGIGATIEAGTASFESCEAFVKKQGEPSAISGKQEKFEQIFSNYL
jgi:xylose isomerase